MIHLTLAIADFVGILVGAALATALAIGAVVLAGIGAAVATLWAARTIVRRMLGR